jgi:hypothetical protein
MGTAHSLLVKRKIAKRYDKIFQLARKGIPQYEIVLIYCARTEATMHVINLP